MGYGFQNLANAFNCAAADQGRRAWPFDLKGLGMNDVQIDGTGKADRLFKAGFPFPALDQVVADFRVHDYAAFAMRTPIYAAADVALTQASSGASSFSGSNN